ncbi:hypothetical protein FG386_003075 [Cryptosporidium ryanae]|uniref:uncharacterized protein n=1 Tax=Cryptosporidium ryanae TaxID=515981 RepID=UPI00351AA73C|nr:hypothetical protein FG386_003075 [Cryptosporidium ryanae]
MNVQCNADEGVVMLNGYYNQTDNETSDVHNKSNEYTNNSINNNCKATNNYCETSTVDASNSVSVENTCKITIKKHIFDELNICEDLDTIFNRMVKDNKVIKGTFHDIIQLLIKIYSTNDCLDNHLYNEIEELIVVGTDIYKWEMVNYTISYMINNKSDYKLIFGKIKKIKFINNEFPCESKFVSNVLEWLFLYIVNDITAISEIYFESCIFIRDKDLLYNFCKRRRINEVEKINLYKEEYMLTNGEEMELDDIYNEQFQNTNMTNDSLRESKKNTSIKSNFNNDFNTNGNCDCLISSILERILKENKCVLEIFTIKNLKLCGYQICNIFDYTFGSNNIKIKEIIVDRIYNSHYSIVSEAFNNNFYGCGYAKSNVSDINNTKESNFNILSKISFSNNSINSIDAYKIFNYITKRKYKETEEKDNFDDNKDNNELFIDLSNNFITETFFLYLIKNCICFKNRIIIDLTGNPLDENGIYLNKNKYVKYNIYVICKYLFPKTYYDDLIELDMNYTYISGAYKYTLKHFNYLELNRKLFLKKPDYYYSAGSLNDNCPNSSVICIKNDYDNKNNRDNNSNYSNDSFFDKNVSLNSEIKNKSSDDRNICSPQYYDDLYDSEEDDDYEEEEDDEEEDDEEEDDEEEDDEEEDDEDDDEVDGNEEDDKDYINIKEHIELNGDEKEGDETLHKNKIETRCKCVDLSENDNITFKTVAGRNYFLNRSCEYEETKNSKYNLTNKGKNKKKGKVVIVQEEDAVESLISEARENSLRFRINQEKWI